MKIEEAIKQQRGFRNVYHKATVNLLYTHSHVFNRQKDFFKQFDITPQQYNVLRILKGQYPKTISTSDIRDRMLDKYSDTSRIVDRMVTAQLLERKTCPSDKRLVDVLISEKGLALLEKIDNAANPIDNMFSSHLTEHEAEMLNDLLDKLRG
jgi:DNA-binding MarR family transcriptional regulator